MRLPRRMRIWSKHSCGWQANQPSPWPRSRSAGFRFAGRRETGKLVILLLLSFCCSLGRLLVSGFSVSAVESRSKNFMKKMGRRRICFDSLAVMGSAEDEDAEMSSEDEEELGDSGIVIEDLNWRVQKLRLEEENTKRFLKAKPRFLPYDDCRKWVQAWGQRWQTEQDWKDWIAMGEKRNSYIPSQPDAYYSSLGQWKGWDHFLGSNSESDGSTTEIGDGGFL